MYARPSQAVVCTQSMHHTESACCLCDACGSPVSPSLSLLTGLGDLAPKGAGDLAAAADAAVRSRDCTLLCSSSHCILIISRLVCVRARA